VKTRNDNKDEGFVLVVVAVMLVVILGFVALGVDVGVLYGAKTSAQEVADAAALAGAFTFINNPTAVQPDTAYNHALEVALNNSILGQPVTAANVTVNVDVANRSVKVDVSSTQNTYFARVLGTNTANVAAAGIAEAAQYSTGATCVKPWFIPNTIFASGGACPACAANELLISGGEVTAFAKSHFGQQFTLKPQNPSTSIAPGQFYAIQLPGSSGGADYRSNIASCATPYLRCGNSYSVETGNMVGPTAQGVRDLIGNPSTDTWTGTIGEYQTPNGLSDMSRNVVVAPIWDSCSMSGFCPAGNFPSGTTVTLQIIGFATFFLEGIQGGDVQARLISVSSCGATSGGSGGGAGSSETGGTVLSLPLRLVRQP
jgi:putative Flp pilus-assembly TadE/G-like protein